MHKLGALVFSCIGGAVLLEALAGLDA